MNSFISTAKRLALEGCRGCLHHRRKVELCSDLSCKKKAFGLLETVIAMMIVTMTVLAVYDSVAQSRRVIQSVSERSSGINFVSIFTNEPSFISDKDNIDFKAHIASRYGISDMALIPVSFETNASTQDTRNEEKIFVGCEQAGKVRKYISQIDGRRTEWFVITPGE